MRDETRGEAEGGRQTSVIWPDEIRVGEIELGDPNDPDRECWEDEQFEESELADNWADDDSIP